MTGLLAPHRPPTPVELQRARENIPWVEDDDLRTVEEKSGPGATLLGFFTWGGGLIYVGEYLKGTVGIGALIAWLAVAPQLVEPIGGLGFLAGGVAAAIASFRKARAVNRFVATRDQLALASGASAPHPAAYRLLAAHAAADPHALGDLGRMPPPAAPMLTAAAGGQPYPHTPVPGGASPHAELIGRLRKLAAVRAANLISDTELRERKVDLLQAATPPTRAALDDLLFELVPLVQEGVLLDEDIAFLKRLAGVG